MTTGSNSPLISFVLVTRNDNYEGNPVQRLKTSLTSNLARLSEALPGNFEILIGDWGSQEPLTRQMLGVESQPAVRLFYFPLEVVQQFKSVFDEVHSLNFLIRTAGGKFVARLDQDIILGTAFTRYLATEGLHDEKFYWSNRRDLPEGQLSEAGGSVEEYSPSAADFYRRGIGVIIASKSIWETIRGYNEAYIYRDNMEHDLYPRLSQQAGLVNLGMLLDSPFFHLRHTRCDGLSRAFNTSRPPFANGLDWGLANYASLVKET